MNHEHHHEHANHSTHDMAVMKHDNHSNHDQEDGYNKHAGHSIENFKRKLYISLVATVPILLLSPFIQGLLNISIKFPGDQWILFLISSFVFFFGGSPFLIGAWDEMRHKALGMMTLISLAIIVAYVYSSAVTFGLMGEIFFWELATLIDIMLLGHWLEMKSVMGASMALEKLSALIPDIAHVKRGIETKDVNVSELKKMT